MKRILLTLMLIATVVSTQTMDFVFDKTKKPDSTTILHADIDDANGKIFILAELKKDHYNETIHAHSFRCSLGSTQTYNTFTSNSLEDEPKRESGENARVILTTLRSLYEKQKLAAQTVQKTEVKQ